MSFENFVSIYMEDMKHRLKEHSYIHKEYIINGKLLPFFGKLSMSQITPAIIRKWQNELISYRNEKGQPFSVTYLKNINKQLSAIFNYAVQYYDLKENPCHKAGSIAKGSADEMLFWTTEEFKVFLEKVSNKPPSRAGFLTLYYTGLRIGELLALEYCDIDFEGCKLTVDKSYQRIQGRDVITLPKTPRSVRTISLPVFLRDELKAYTERLYGLHKHDRIFPYTKSFFLHEMIRGTKDNQVKRIRLHDIRHPYVKHTTKIFSLRLKVFQAQPVPDALRKTRGAFLHLREGGNHNPFLRPCNKKLSSWSIPQSKMSLILYAISMRLSGYTSTLSMRRSVSSAVNPSELKTALAASCRLSCRACSSCFCFACANTTA